MPPPDGALAPEAGQPPVTSPVSAPCEWEPPACRAASACAGLLSQGSRCVSLARALLLRLLPMTIARLLPWVCLAAAPPALPGASPPAALLPPPAGKVPAASYSPPPSPDAVAASPPAAASPPTQQDPPPSPPQGATGWLHGQTQERANGSSCFFSSHPRSTSISALHSSPAVLVLCLPLSSPAAPGRSLEHPCQHPPAAACPCLMLLRTARCRLFAAAAVAAAAAEPSRAPPLPLPLPADAALPAEQPAASPPAAAPASPDGSPPPAPSPSPGDAGPASPPLPSPSPSPGGARPLATCPARLCTHPMLPCQPGDRAPCTRPEPGLLLCLAICPQAVLVARLPGASSPPSPRPSPGCPSPTPRQSLSPRRTRSRRQLASPCPGRSGGGWSRRPLGGARDARCCRRPRQSSRRLRGRCTSWPRAACSTLPRTVRGAALASLAAGPLWLSPPCNKAATGRAARRQPLASPRRHSRPCRLSMGVVLGCAGLGAGQSPSQQAGMFAPPASREAAHSLQHRFPSTVGTPCLLLLCRPVGHRGRAGGRRRCAAGIRCDGCRGRRE